MSTKLTEETVINVTTDDPNDIVRILSLAGVQQQRTPPVEIEQTKCNVCGANDHSVDSCPNMMTVPVDGSEVDEQADYDYGDQDNEQAGHPVDPDTYIWKGPRTPQRLVKGFAGDNPLISELYSKYSEQYSKYLLEDENRENADGNESPLTNPTKPEFDKDPLSGETPVDDGSNSPLSTIVRQPVLD